MKYLSLKVLVPDIATALLKQNTFIASRHYFFPFKGKHAIIFSLYILPFLKTTTIKKRLPSSRLASLLDNISESDETQFNARVLKSGRLEPFLNHDN